MIDGQVEFGIRLDEKIFDPFMAVVDHQLDMRWGTDST